MLENVIKPDGEGEEEVEGVEVSNEGEKGTEGEPVNETEGEPEGERKTVLKREGLSEALGEIVRVDVAVLDAVGVEVRGGVGVDVVIKEGEGVTVGMGVKVDVTV